MKRRSGCPLRLVLLGPPASGKGTQAGMIRDRYGVPSTSTGAILRDEKRKGTPRGLEADRLTRGGGLASDEIVLELVGEWLTAHADQFLFDGFPRTLVQADCLQQMLATRQTPLSLVLMLEVSAETIRSRVKNRMTCGNCGTSVSIGRHVPTSESPCPNCNGKLERRADDNLAALKVRLEQYEKWTAPLGPFYATRGLLRRIDANRESAVVFGEIAEILDALEC